MIRAAKNWTMVWAVVTASVFLGASIPAYADMAEARTVETEKKPEQTEEQLVARYDSFMKINEENGFSGAVLIEDRGSLIYNKAFGYADKKKKIKNTQETLFDIGSITKQFTAAAILKLMENGELSVNDPLSKFFDGAPADKKNITLHQLLTHTSGISAYTGDDYEYLSSEEFLKQVFKRKLKAKPGEKHLYANVGYSLLAMIVEQVSGQPYETFLYENILKPAGLENTGYLRLDYSQHAVAQGYNYRNNKLWGSSVERWAEAGGVSWHLKGNGGILSTTLDMYKWHRAIQTAKVLKPETIELYQARHVLISDSTQHYYAYGWGISSTQSGKVAGHDGSNGIFFAIVRRYIDTDTAIIYMTNEVSPGAAKLPKELVYILRFPDYEPEIIQKPTRLDRLKCKVNCF